MAIGRRFPPPVPNGPAPSLQRVWLALITLWRYVQYAHSGLPAPHEATHLATGSDPLQTPTAPRTIAIANVIGSGPSYAYEDHVHASGLTVKGDLLTRTGSASARLGVGTDGQSLLADSSQSTGLKWGTPQEAEDAEFLAWVM